MAKRFKFSLESLLNLKKRNADEKAEIFAKDLQQQILLEKEKESYLEEREQTRDNFTKNHKHLSIEILHGTNKRLDYLDRLIIHMTNLIKEAKIKTENSREILIAAEKDKKIIETLKENQYQEYLRELLHKEQSESDEQNSRLKSFQHIIDGTVS